MVEAATMEATRVPEPFIVESGEEEEGKEETGQSTEVNLRWTKPDRRGREAPDLDRKTLIFPEECWVGFDTEEGEEKGCC